MCYLTSVLWVRLPVNSRLFGGQKLYVIFQLLGGGPLLTPVLFKSQGYFGIYPQCAGKTWESLVQGSSTI